MRICQMLGYPDRRRSFAKSISDPGDVIDAAAGKELRARVISGKPQGHKKPGVSKRVEGRKATSFP
jgi:hypothetical protein